MNGPETRSTAAPSVDGLAARDMPPRPLLAREAAEQFYDGIVPGAVRAGLIRAAGTPCCALTRAQAELARETTRLRACLLELRAARRGAGDPAVAGWIVTRWPLLLSRASARRRAARARLAALIDSGIAGPGSPGPDDQVTPLQNRRPPATSGA